MSTRIVSRLFTDYFPREKADRLPEMKNLQESSPFLVLPETPEKKAPEGVTSNRIFIAKIPPRVSADDLRKHFQVYGPIEDAYRPKDFVKNTFRGIGFVAFARPDSVDRALAEKHYLGGAEVVVDRATPKEDSARRSNDSPDMGLKSAEASLNNALGGSFNERTFDLNFFNSISRHIAYPNSNGNNCGPPSSASDELVSDGFILGESKERSEFSPRARQLSVRTQAAKSEKKNRVSTNNMAHVRKVRGGPRIFVGKLSKDTVEQDLAEYFSQFGFVMDVYIPRSKENKRDHRGFGFVTFETEASIKRVVSQITHSLKGATLAIDVAVPESPSAN